MFELTDLLAERWLRHAQPFGGLAEVKRIGHGEEVTEVAEFDGYGAIVVRGLSEDGPGGRAMSEPLS